MRAFALVDVLGVHDLRIRQRLTLRLAERRKRRAGRFNSGDEGHAQASQSVRDLDVRLAGGRQEGALLDLQIDWPPSTRVMKPRKLSVSRIGDGDRHVHASRHVRHREGDDGFEIGVRQVAEAIGDLDRRRREIEVLGDKRDLVRLSQLKAAGPRVAVLSSAREAALDNARTASKTKPTRARRCEITPSRPSSSASPASAGAAR